MSNRITRQSDSRDSDTNRRAFTFALNSCYRGHVCCSSLASLCSARQSYTMQAMHLEKQVARTLTDNWARPRSLISFLVLAEAVEAEAGGTGCRCWPLPMHIHSQLLSQTQESESEQRRRFSKRKRDSRTQTGCSLLMRRSYTFW